MGGGGLRVPANMLMLRDDRGVVPSLEVQGVANVEGDPLLMALCLL